MQGVLRCGWQSIVIEHQREQLPGEKHLSHSVAESTGQNVADIKSQFRLQ